VTETLANRTARSLVRFRETYPDITEPVLVVAGGVAANRAIRTSLETLCGEHGFRLVAPPLELCGDNGAMIAWAGLDRLRAGLAEENPFAFAPRSRWPLDMEAEPLIGSGRRGAKA
jgi:N6-L-threonylcarbamoyladenine synthase